MVGGVITGNSNLYEHKLEQREWTIMLLLANKQSTNLKVWAESHCAEIMHCSMKARNAGHG